LNDVEDDVFKEGPKIEFFTDYVSIYESTDALSGYSQFWGWARQRYLRSFQARNYLQQCIDSFSVNSEGWKQCRKALGDIATICSSRDIRLLVVVFPFYYGLDGDYPFQSIHDTVWTHCKSLDVDVLDLRDRYRKYKGPEMWVHPTDQHPNEIAHGIAAESIADFLVVNASQLLPDR
jgi:hypothetical protein